MFTHHFLHFFLIYLKAGKIFNVLLTLKRECFWELFTQIIERMNVQNFGIIFHIYNLHELRQFTFRFINSE